MWLHHVGIVVDNLEEATPLFEVWMGAVRVGNVVQDEIQQARIQLFLMPGDMLLEVVEALPGSPMHQSGEFHLCFTVPDLDAEMARLHNFGNMVNRGVATATLFNDQRIAFLATHSGQLLELLEDPSLPPQ